jgi:hypothetical protein
MTTTVNESWVGLQRLAAALGTLGAGLGLLAGVVELTAGPSIRSWVGNKEDTTRLGLATVLLAAVALLAAVVLRRAAASPTMRFAAAVGLVAPGLICFTTVGRVWYLPGAILVAAGVLALADLRQEAHTVRTTLNRNWTAILAAVLALFYVFLGATALGFAGLVGILGGLAVLGLLALHTKLSRPFGLALLMFATLPFALLTWWSLATPLIGVLVLATGSAALGRDAARARLP